MPSIRLPKIILGLVLIFASMGHLQAQYNLRNKINKPYYFGITMGYNTTNYQVQLSQEYLAQNLSEYSVIEAVRGSGINFNLVTNLKLNDHFDLRALPGISFGSRGLVYSPSDTLSTDLNQEVQAVFAEFPIHLRYLSKPYKDIRVFILSGIKYSYDIQSNSRDRDITKVRVAPNEFAAEVGLGVQIFFPYFIFSPELKYTHGFSNTIINNLSPENSIHRVLTRGFSLSLHFEG